MSNCLQLIEILIEMLSCNQLILFRTTYYWKDNFYLLSPQTAMQSYKSNYKDLCYMG